MAKMKHWQGYGSVDAKKIADYPYGSSKRKTVVMITGNHEYGIVREDPYDVFRWLGKRFFPACRDYRRIEDLAVVPGTEKAPDGTEIDTAVYEVTYWTY